MKIKEFRALLEQRIADREKCIDRIFNDNFLMSVGGEIQAFKMVLSDLENLDKDYIPRHENVEL